MQKYYLIDNYQKWKKLAEYLAKTKLKHLWFESIVIVNYPMLTIIFNNIWTLFTRCIIGMMSIIYNCTFLNTFSSIKKPSPFHSHPYYFQTLVLLSSYYFLKYSLNKLNKKTSKHANSVLCSIREILEEFEDFIDLNLFESAEDFEQEEWHVYFTNLLIYRRWEYLIRNLLCTKGKIFS